MFVHCPLSLLMLIASREGCEFDSRGGLTVFYFDLRLSLILGSCPDGFEHHLQAAH